MYVASVLHDSSIYSLCVVKLIPEWFPGGGFKRIAKQMREDLERLYNVPFGYVLSQMVLSSLYIVMQAPGSLTLKNIIGCR